MSKLRVLGLLIHMSLLLSVLKALDFSIMDVTIDVCDDEYCDPEGTYSMINYDEEPYTVTLNIKIKKDVPEDARVTVDGYFYSMGDFTEPVGLSIDRQICDGFNEPVLVKPIFEMLGIIEEACPPKVGSIGMQDYFPPTDYLPDYFPPNKYRAIFSSVYEDQVLFSISIYVDVEDE